MSTTTVQVTHSRQDIPIAITLFFVAPFVAEYLIGDLSLYLLLILVMVAPMYGGAAVLIREFGRSKGGGWPRILCLSAACSVLVNGGSQSLFNSGCQTLLQVHFLPSSFAHWLGIGGWWTEGMLDLHCFWSIGISIVLVEGLFPERAHEPWLGWVGRTIFGALFVLGLVWDAMSAYKTNNFCATPMQIGVATLLFLSLVVIAFVIPVGKTERVDGNVPSPWLTGVVTFVLALLLLQVPIRWAWSAIFAILTLDVAFLLMAYALSKRSVWTPLHTLSLGAGGAVAYGLHAFLQKPFEGGAVQARVGNAIFLAVACVLVMLGAKRTAAAVKESEPVTL